MVRSSSLVLFAPIVTVGLMHKGGTGTVLTNISLGLEGVWLYNKNLQ